MELFSHRMGFKPIKSEMQIEFVDEELRNRLWTVLFLIYWKEKTKHSITLLKKLWFRYFKKPIDTLPNFWSNAVAQIRQYFFTCKWFEVYDFMEFIANNYPDKTTNQKFIKLCNRVLEEELSAYRFVGSKIVPITSEVEISEIEEALVNSDPLKGTNTHLQRALELLGDRKSPDYRNSIKESISAVESICKLITGEEKTTLGQALRKLEDKGIKLHPAFQNALNSLYGYTSDAEGIRHALLEEPNLDFEDAKFMLVSCSAFINYLITKVSKAGIEI